MNPLLEDKFTVVESIYPENPDGPIITINHICYNGKKLFLIEEKYNLPTEESTYKLIKEIVDCSIPKLDKELSTY